MTAEDAGAALSLSGCTFGWLHRAPLADALRSLAAHGFRSIELTTAPPHLFTRHFGSYERKELARLLQSIGLEVVSVNPSFADINLVSTNPEIREISERQLAAEIELAADLGAGLRGGDPRPEARAGTRPRRRGTGRPRRGPGETARPGAPSLA